MAEKRSIVLSVLPTQHLGAFLLTVSALILVPGPSVLFVVSRGIALGRRAAITTVVGNASGLALQLVLVSVGAGVLITGSRTALTTLSLMGAGYLVVLGLRTIRDSRTEPSPLARPLQAGQPFAVSLRQGFIVGATNPKGFAIFAAVLPQFVDRGAGGVTGQLLALGTICLAAALAYDSAWAVAAASAARWFAASNTRFERLRAAGGTVLVVLGVGLAVATAIGS